MAIAALLLAVLTPLDLSGALAGLHMSASSADYVQELPWRFYLLLKGLILWVPLGFLVALTGHVTARVFPWLALGVAGLMLVSMPWLQVVYMRDLVDILAVFPGFVGGFWLGRRTGRSIELVVRRELPRHAHQADPPRGHAASVPMGDGKVEGDVHRRREGAKAAGLLNGEEAAKAPDSEVGSRVRSHRGLHGMQANRAVSHIPQWVIRIAGLSLLGVMLGILLDFPRWQFPLGTVLAIYIAALWRWPWLVLVVVPAALPLLDMAPWTGRFFLDEFDMLMLASAGTLMLRGGLGDRAVMSATGGLLIFLFLVSGLVSASIGLAPLPPVDANATVSYWSPYNAIRQAKGFLWAAVLVQMVRLMSTDRHLLAWRIAIGMGIGLLGVGLVGAWEHHLFVGFQGKFEWYRIVSTFSSMHTGGGHIEAYLVAALPFLWLATPKFRHLAFTAPIMLLTGYVMLYTVARGGVLAIGIVLGILILGSARLAMRSHGRRFIAPVGALVAVGFVVAAGVGVGYFQQRFTETGKDWQTRVDHWAQALSMRDEGLGAQLFGMGLGSFPRYYQERGPVDKQPASFGFAVEQGNTYFRMGTGETVYYAQRIPFSAGEKYRLELDLRSRSGDARLDTPVCEKQLLNSRQCEWFGFAVPGDGAWHRLSRDFSATKVGGQAWFNRPPVELFLYNPGKGGVVDVDNLRLLDPEGRDVLCNGDFSRSGDCWFFKTHSHLPWHIKNVWVHVLFEQGWVGLLLFATISVVALTRLARAGWQGHRLAWTWMASLAGLLTVGMFDSLMDAPRLATLLLAWLGLGAAYVWQERPARQSRAERHARHGLRDRTAQEVHRAH